MMFLRTSARILGASALVAALIGTSATAAQASNTWYVAPTGTDSSCTQGTPFLTIQFAVDCSFPLDTIMIAPGTYAQNLQLVWYQLNLVGAGAGSTIIGPTPGSADPVVSIPGAFGFRLAMRISGVTITGGRSESNGGGISIGQYPDRTGYLTLSDSVVTGNTAAFDGGGIFNEVGSALRLLNTRVVNNTAYDGGGIYNDSGACLHRNSTVASNLPNDIVGC
jgi:hypothetical protein